MSQLVIKHTTIANHPPEILDPGELAVELNSPTRLWVGTPDGVKLLIQTGAGGLQFVDVAGDTMTGPLILNGDPTLPLGAAPKRYVDVALNGLNAAIAAKVAKAGDIMTGPLVLPAANPTADQHAAHKKYVDDGVAAVTPPPVFATGTQTLFYQAAAPVGWTKITASINDKTLRVVSGATGGTAGGTNAFSSVMAQTVVGNFTPSAATTAPHSHNTWQAQWQTTAGGGPEYIGVGGAGGGYVPGNVAGGNAVHNHTIKMSIQYIDLILARKD
jgi:hypothetical protein